MLRPSTSLQSNLLNSLRKLAAYSGHTTSESPGDRGQRYARIARAYLDATWAAAHHGNDAVLSGLTYFEKMTHDSLSPSEISDAVTDLKLFMAQIEGMSADELGIADVFAEAKAPEMEE